MSCHRILELIAEQHRQQLLAEAAHERLLRQLTEEHPAGHADHGAEPRLRGWSLFARPRFLPRG